MKTNTVHLLSFLAAVNSKFTRSNMDGHMQRKHSLHTAHYKGYITDYVMKMLNPPPIPLHSILNIQAGWQES
jgi:hypothetical protein